jgi:hypothetical protein
MAPDFRHDILDRPFMLMCKDIPVFSFSNEKGLEVHSGHLVPPNLDISVQKQSGFNITGFNIGGFSGTELLNFKLRWIAWCSWRTLSVDRHHYKKIVNALNIDQNDTPDYRASVALAYRALSLNDSYWVHFLDGEERPKWAEVSLRYNSLSKGLAVLALTGTSMSLSLKNVRRELTAEISTHGSYAKGWLRDENGELYMYKADTHIRGFPEGVREEVCASKVLSCFNVYSYVVYDEAVVEGVRCSRSKLMTTDDKAIVYASAIDTWGQRNNTNAVEYAKKHWLRDYSQMLVIDYLLANYDRHSGNWGFFQSMTSGEVLGLHDLYDHNCCFSDFAMRDEDLQSRHEKDDSDKTYLSMKDAALKYISDSGLRLLKEPTADMFPSEEAFRVFNVRCSQLGLKYESGDFAYEMQF